MTLQEKELRHKQITDRLIQNAITKDLTYEKFIELSKEQSNLSIQIRAEKSIIAGEWREDIKTFAVPVFKNLRK